MRPSTSVTWYVLWLGALLALALIYTWATWRFFTVPFPGGNDFLARYTAWQVYFEAGVSPYSDEAALRTNLAVYGRPPLPGEDENHLIYPFYSVVFHGPFILFDYAVARAIHMTVLQAALFAGVIMSLQLARWRPPTWMLAAILGWSLLNYSAARAVILGQVAIVGFAALAGTLFLLQGERDGAAGALLVATTFKPTLVFAVIPFLLLWALARQRWRFIAGFLGTLLAAMAVSFVFLPTWFGEWVQRVSNYPSYTVGQSPIWVVAHQAIPALGTVGEGLLTGGLVGAMLWSWWRAIRSKPEASGEFHWALGLTLTVSNFIVPRSATTNYVLLLISTLWLFAAADRRVRAGRWIVLGALAASLIGNWWLHYATVVGRQEQPIMFFPWPLALMVALWAGRHWLLKDARDAALWPMGAEPALARQPYFHKRPANP